MIEPRNDRVLIRRIDKQQGTIVLTDPSKGIEGVVLSVGPGKWISGEWWKIKDKWEWIEGYRQQPAVKPGMKVSFNSKWNDIGDDYQHPHWQLWNDEKEHLVQEADIFGIIG